MKVLVTGCAGFVGFHVAHKLMERGDAVVGLDSVNDYYEPELKEARLAELQKCASRCGAQYAFVRADLADRDTVESLFKSDAFDRVIHLAAQPGVRYSLSHPHAYIANNVDGFMNILEGCRHAKVAHLTFASSSSVYGANRRMPFSEHDGVDHPLSLYAATKRANELMAHAYSHLYGLPMTGLRFFTVYGPWGRPDMAPMIFTRKLLAGEPIEMFNDGNHSRDFTYIDDIVEGVVRVSDKIATPAAGWDASSPDPATSNAPFRLFNIGCSSPVALAEFVEALESTTGKKAVRVPRPLQPGDVVDTHADMAELHRYVGYSPVTSVSDGVRKFVKWYRAYYG